jgi:hypothetical protein
VDEDEMFPCFLDIEASSFARESYPIDVAWSDAEGEIHRCLVSPRHVPHWTDWDPAAEAIHGIDHARLLRNGWDPSYVAAMIEEDLRGQVVYSDAPEFDRHWLQRLFEVVDRPLPCLVEHVDELLIELMRQPGEMIWEVSLRLEALKAELKPLLSGGPVARYDVGYLMQLLRRARGFAAKMNHGMGRLPQVSPTGTFLPVKQRRLDRPQE